MTFQFECPNGHLLEGEPSMGGQECQCPQCGIDFLVPTPPPEVAAAPPQAATDAPPVSTGPPAFDAYGASSGPRMLHIPCPSGHMLETPADMLNQDVLCPHCGVQFMLREKNSVEFKRRKEEELARREHLQGKKWLNWAIVIGVVVLLGLATLIGVSMSR